VPILISADKDGLIVITRRTLLTASYHQATITLSDWPWTTVNVLFVITGQVVHE